MKWCSPRRWLSKFIDLLCGYGETPWKVIVSAVVIIFGFALYYFLLEAAAPSPAISSNAVHQLTVREAVYFSFVTFTTLGYGDYRPIPCAQPVAMCEAFIGAFMIALFVLVFGRKMMR